MWINTANPVKCAHVYHGTYVRTRTCTCVPGCCFYCIHNFFTHCICQFLLRASHPSACCSVTRLVRALTVRQPQQHQTTGTCTATGASPGCLLRSAPRGHARVKKAAASCGVSNKRSTASTLSLSAAGILAELNCFTLARPRTAGVVAATTSGGSKKLAGHRGGHL